MHPMEKDKGAHDRGNGAEARSILFSLDSARRRAAPLRQVPDARARAGPRVRHLFSVGTTSTFPYIAEPVLQAKWRGTPTVEINPGYSEITDVFNFKFFSGAAETLDALWALYTGE